MFAKHSKTLKTRTGAKPAAKPAAKPTRKPVDPLPEMLFERINLKSFRGVRNCITRVVKHTLNGTLPVDRARTALPWVQSALSVAHALQLKDRLEKISELLDIPPDSISNPETEPLDVDDLAGEDDAPDGEQDEE